MSTSVLASKRGDVPVKPVDVSVLSVASASHRQGGAKIGRGSTDGASGGGTSSNRIS